MADTVLLFLYTEVNNNNPTDYCWVYSTVTTDGVPPTDVMYLLGSQ